LNRFSVPRRTFRILAQQIDSSGLRGIEVVGGRALDLRAQCR